MWNVNTRLLLTKKRIDYRIGGTNPVLIELAVRPPKHKNKLYGSQNRHELRKLCRAPYSKAKKRILLLVDLAKEMIRKDKIKKTYDKAHSGKGGAHRRAPVSVIYVHKKDHYSVRWSRSAYTVV